MSSLLISDLHLSPQQPDTVRRFLDFLEHTAPRADALYILGDLFDYWIGDDSLAEPFNAAIAQALAALRSKGCHVFLLRGNRDFLLGDAFARASGVAYLPAIAAVDLYGTPTLLLHGDELCTGDTGYQTFRAQVRSPAWQGEFLAKPVAERKALVESLRQRSEAEKRIKADGLMDATPAAIDHLLRQHGHPRLIHGHTHRPARHLHSLDGHTCERWVLPSWDDQPGYLECAKTGCSLLTINIKNA